MFDLFLKCSSGEIFFCREQLPEQFWREIVAAWRAIQPDLHLNVASLANIEALDSVEPEDSNAAWLKQNWWQTQVDAHFKLNAPERLRALQTLNSAHRATDITSLVSSDEGPVDFLSRKASRMRTGLALDALDFRSCPGCGVMYNSGDYVLCCRKQDIYARHNEIRNELADLCSDLNLHVDVEKGPNGTLLRPADVLVHGFVDEALAWSTLCKLQSKSRRCNQASWPKRWSNKKSAKRCVSATAGGSSPLSSKRSASSAARPSS